MDLARKDTVYYGYEENYGAFVPYGEIQAIQGGQPVINRWVNRRPAQTLWGSPAQLRFDMGGLIGHRPRNPFDYIPLGELEPRRSAPEPHTISPVAPSPSSITPDTSPLPVATLVSRMTASDVADSWPAPRSVLQNLVEGSTSSFFASYGQLSVEVSSRIP